MNKQDKSSEEYIKRNELYKTKIKNALVSDNENSKKNSFIETVISDKSEILDIFRKYKRDKISFKIEDGKQKYLNNKIISIDNDILISNPFTTFANKNFPKQIRCIVKKDGNEYGFLLRKINDKDTGNYIKCLIPDEISVLKRRFSERADDHSKSAIGLFFDSKEKEIIGYMRDISETGIGFSISDNSIDSDSLSLISNNSNYKFPILIENKNEYTTVLINVKYTLYNKENKTIDIGGSFEYIDKDEKLSIKKIFKNIQKEDILLNQKEKTLNLINCSKMNITI